MARTAVIAGTATAVSGAVANKQHQKAMAQQQQAMAQQAPPAAPAAAEAAEPDYVAELEKLAQLKSQGILTEEEFQAKKKQLLGI